MTGGFNNLLVVPGVRDDRHASPVLSCLDVYCIVLYYVVSYCILHIVVTCLDLSWTCLGLVLTFLDFS